MKKRMYIGIGIMIVIIIIVTVGYIRINRMYPPSKVVEADMGETLEYQDGVMITVNKAEYLTDEQRNQTYERMGETPLVDLKILDVTLTLENTSAESKKVTMTNLYVEGIGASNGVSKNHIDSSDGKYGSLTQELQAGESRQIILPYEILSNQFSKKLWDKIEEQKFWLTFSSYPEKTKLNLNIR